MKTLRRQFTDHPASVGESYADHAHSAFGFAWRLQVASWAALVHALLPFLFAKTASGLVLSLHQRMVMQRHRVGTGSGN